MKGRLFCLSAAWCIEAHASALAEMAVELAPTATVRPTCVVSSTLQSDEPAPKGGELTSLLSSLVAGRLGPRARAHPVALPRDKAAQVCGKAHELIFLRPQVRRGGFEVSLDHFPSQKNPWERVRNRNPEPTHHAFSTRPVDAEIRTYLTPLSLERLSLRRFRHGEGEVLAAACGELSGKLATVLVTRQQAVVGHLAEGKFVPVERVAWKSRVPIPLREPLGTAALGQLPGELGLWVGSSDHGGMRLPNGRLSGLPLLVGRKVACAPLAPETGGLSSSLVDCVSGAPVEFSARGITFDAFASASLVDAHGVRSTVTGLRESSGKLRGIWDGHPDATLDGVGAELAVGDLDEDGAPEFLTSRDQGDDAVTVRTWVDGKWIRRAEFPAPEGVRALSVCSPDGVGPVPAIACVGGEVWVVR